MSTSDNCKDGASKSNIDGVCKVNDMLHNTSVDDVSVCANCGKEGSNDNMNTCNKCNVVKYCNAVCKKVHKKKHKKDCEEYVRLATEKHDEEIRLLLNCMMKNYSNSHRRNMEIVQFVSFEYHHL